MNILWITNIIFPEAQLLLTGSGALKSSGGWLMGASDALVNSPNIHLAVASMSSRVRRLTRLEGEKITYYLLPLGKGNRRLNHNYESLWKQVRDMEKPDVVHLHGTEFTHGLSYVDSCGSKGVCVSIQGLVSAISDYYYAGLSPVDILRSETPYSILYGGLIKAKKDFAKRGKYEDELLKKVNHILGRTKWDRAHTWAINPNAHYYYAGETLRREFYGNLTWKYEDCVPYSIFLSQANSAIKGMHKVLMAMPYVLRHFPEASIRVAGYDLCSCRNIRDFLHLSNYGSILRKIIKKYKLDNKITFTGPLDAEGMRKEYLQSNVFICPSAIENSPNSLGEAQILGVPVIASYVGGIPDMMFGNENNLYRFEDVESLANKIVSLFEARNTVNTSILRQEALLRHNPEKNIKELLSIYSVVAHN